MGGERVPGVYPTASHAVMQAAPVIFPKLSEECVLYILGIAD